MADGSFTRYAGEHVIRPIYGPLGTVAGEELWLPAIPGPFRGFRNACHCGRKFWTLDGYRSHYALVHILEVDHSTGGEA